MSEFGHDENMTNEYSGVSVDDILEEFQRQEKEAASQALYQSYLDSLPTEEELAAAPPPVPVDEDGVKLYQPKGGASSRLDRAPAYVPPRAQPGYAPAQVEPSYEYEAPSPQPDYAYAAPAQDYSNSYAYTQPDRDYAPQATAEPDYDEPDYGYTQIKQRNYVPSDKQADEEIEIDSRFNLSGKRDKVYFDGQPLDLGSDDSYIPPSQEAWIPSHWGSGDGEYQPEDYDGGEIKKDKKHRRKKNKKKNKKALNAPPSLEDEEDYAASFSDLNPEDFGEGYAPPADYSFDRDDERQEQKSAGGFPSFGQYLAGLVTGFLFRIRGAGGSSISSTMEDDDEDLGAEQSPATVSKYYGSHVHSLRLRFRIGLVLLVIMCYISLGLPLPGMLKTVQVQAAMCLGFQLTIMLLCLDVLTGSAINMARGSFGADSLAGLSCILTSIDALAVALDGFGSPHLPLCLLSSLSLMGVLLSSLLSARGLRKCLRVPAIGKRSYAVTGETGVKGSDITLLKSTRSSAGFVRRAEEAPPDETLFSRASPILLIAALLLALVVCLVKKSWGDFLYVFTALLAPAVPVAALLCFALPFFVGSTRIFSSGAAIAGWSGLCDVGQSKNLIVTDRDLFPDGSAELDSIRIFADEKAEKIISYAGTMISASGSSISQCFAQLMEKNGGSMRHVENFEYLSGGGMRGIIDGEHVLCGGIELMRLMNVRIPYRLVEKTTVLLAIDGVLYGIFNMKYTAQPQVRKALVSLMKSNRHPIFAIRDFNVSPEMLHQSFDVATDGYDFPPYVERFAISEAKPAQDSKISALVCREGLGPLTHMADTGRSMYLATRVNLLITLLSAIIGVLSVFIKFIGSGSVGTGFLLLFMLLWAVPVAVISIILKF